MLRLGDDWNFAIDEDRSRLWLGPRGDWGFEVVCERRKVDTSDGIGEMLAPKLRIDGLMLEGVDWRELVGLEIYQQGPWLGDGEPEAIVHVVETSELRDTRMVVTAVEGQKLRLEMVAECDVYVDDDHDTKVPLSTMNSPTNPLVPGKPTELIATITNSVAYTGITLARPPKSARSRVWRRS